MNLILTRTSRSLIAGVLSMLSACSTTSDERTVQPPKTDGDGGCRLVDAEEVNWLTLRGSLVITDAHNPELSLVSEVGTDGFVLLPKLGAVRLAGLTCSEIEALLTEMYGPYFDQLDIDVQIRPASKQYFVFGEVASEGGQPFAGDLTIFEAVTKAQPRTASANLHRVRLIRPDPRDPMSRTLDLTVDLQRLIDTGDSTDNVHVQESDIIYVPPVEPK